MAVEIRYLLHASFQLITAKGTNILVDPWLTGDPAYDIAPSPFTMDQLGAVEMVLVSHAGFDHLGNSIEIVKRTGALLVCGPDVMVHAKQNGVPPDKIAPAVWGATITHKDVAIKVLESHHVSFLATGGTYITGIPLSFIIRADTGEGVYYPGDTALHSDLKLVGELYKPDVALLGIGGVDVNGRAVAEMDPFEAAMAAEWLRAKVAVPMHYLRKNVHEPEQFVKHLKARAPHIRPVVLEPGQSFSYPS